MICFKLQKILLLFKESQKLGFVSKVGFVSFVLKFVSKEFGDKKVDRQIVYPLFIKLHYCSLCSESIFAANCSVSGNIFFCNSRIPFTNWKVLVFTSPLNEIFISPSDGMSIMTRVPSIGCGGGANPVGELFLPALVDVSISSASKSSISS